MSWYGKCMDFLINCLSTEKCNKQTPWYEENLATKPGKLVLIIFHSWQLFHKHHKATKFKIKKSQIQITFSNRLKTEYRVKNLAFIKCFRVTFSFKRKLFKFCFSLTFICNKKDPQSYQFFTNWWKALNWISDLTASGFFHVTHLVL